MEQIYHVIVVHCIQSCILCQWCLFVTMHVKATEFIAKPYHLVSMAFYFSRWCCVVYRDIFHWECW